MNMNVNNPRLKASHFFGEQKKGPLRAKREEGGSLMRLGKYFAKDKLPLPTAEAVGFGRGLL
jgi:hypothetical protein